MLQTVGAEFPEVCTVEVSDFLGTVVQRFSIFGYQTNSKDHLGLVKITTSYHTTDLFVKCLWGGAGPENIFNWLPC